MKRKIDIQDCQTDLSNNLTIKMFPKHFNVCILKGSKEQTATSTLVIKIARVAGWGHQ